MGRGGRRPLLPPSRAVAPSTSSPHLPLLPHAPPRPPCRRPLSARMRVRTEKRREKEKKKEMWGPHHFLSLTCGPPHIYFIIFF
ncbi:hypothetical protein [Oryza sativa Japonica Group]|uniref:Uncharacterized protein n=1 Tax=Oryza sativa subsp. japonica TaxID=39947 RepID=Q5JNS3_ORYSJ|nr:hypothetical protein [Oryza sativa Japonica Group]